MRRWKVAGWALGLWVGACVPQPTPVRIGPLLDETRANHMAVMAKYGETLVSFDGVVLSQGTRRVEKVEAKYGWGSHKAQLQRTPVHHPFLYIGDPSGRQDGAILCYFHPDKMEDIARFVPGTRVSLRGIFQEPSQSSHGLDLVVNNCQRP